MSLRYRNQVERITMKTIQQTDGESFQNEFSMICKQFQEEQLALDREREKFR